MGTISDGIKRAIERDGRAWSDIAKAADVHKSTITRFMQGRGLSTENADLLCRALGLALAPSTSRKRGKGRR